MNKHALQAAVSALALSAASPCLAAAPSAEVDATSCLTAGSDLFLNPFSKESAHHRPLGSNAVFADNDDPTTAQIRRAGFNNVNSPATSGYGFSFFEAKAGDPTVTVTYAGPNGPHDLPVTVKVPKEVLAPSGGEGVVVIYDSATGKAHEFLHWKGNNGKPTASIHHEWDIREKGHTGPGGERVGLSASGVAGMFGIIRGHEVNTPGCKIQHAMQITVSLDGACSSMIANKTVGPASSTDSSCKSGACRGALPYGELLAIPPKPSIPIDSLNLSEPGSRMAEALQNYGVYVVDTTGACPNMRADQEVNRETQQQLTNDMHKIFPLLRAVTNNDLTEPTAGGGTPCAENAAFDAQEVDPTIVACNGDHQPVPPPEKVPPPEDEHKPVPPPEKTPPEDHGLPPDKVPPPPDPKPVPPPEKGPLHEPVPPPEKVPPHDPLPPQEVVDPPNDEAQDWQQKAAEWLWEHLPRTTEGFKLFREWLIEFWK